MFFIYIVGFSSKYSNLNINNSLIFIILEKYKIYTYLYYKFKNNLLTSLLKS